MTKLKVKGLKWKMLKVREVVLDFCLIFPQMVGLWALDKPKFALLSVAH